MKIYEIVPKCFKFAVVALEGDINCLQRNIEWGLEVGEATEDI